MNIWTHRKPALMGSLMGLMMLAMVHLMMTSESNLAGTALVAFVGAHLALVLGLVAISWWAIRFSPALRARISKLHRPDTAHITVMLIAALLAAGLSHLALHGGI